MEATQHAQSSFVTLTYAPDPVDGGPWSLRPCDLQAWLKRLRRRCAPARLRFFAVGEYGDHFQRPHYHAALFGYPACFGGPVRNGACECPACLGVRETWGFGHVFVGRLELASARYIARYTLKKMTSPEDLRLEGRSPEFMRCSLRPGIGADAMLAVASVLNRYPSKPLPGALLHGGKAKPLGRYLRRRIALLTGREVEPYVDNSLPVVQAFAYENNRSIQSVYQEVNGPAAAALEAKLSTQLPLSTGQQLQSKRVIF